MSSITLNATQAAYVSQYYNTKNFNNPENLFVGLFNEPNSIYESFLMFDLSSIPTNATINSATLKLYVNKLTSPSATNQYISVIPNLASFNASTITWETQPTNNNIPAGNISISSSNVNSYVNINLTQLVEGWITTPSSNYGVSLMGQIDRDAVIFISGNGNSLQAPQLVVEYTHSNIEVGTTQTVTVSNAGTVYSNAVPVNANTPINRPVNFQVFQKAFTTTPTKIEYTIQACNDGSSWCDDMQSTVTVNTPEVGQGYILITNSLAKQYRVKIIVTGASAAGSIEVTAITPAN